MDIERFTFIVILVILSAVVCAVAWADDIGIETVAYEGAGENIAGQVLIAKTIINRSKEQKQTIEQVCYARYQFSCYNKTKTPRKLTKKEIEKATQAWELAKESSSKVNHYCQYDIADKTYWTKSPKCEFLGRVGEHNFYYISK